MKYTNAVLMMFGCVLFLIITSFAYMQNASDHQLRLTIDSKKKVYKLGEPIHFLIKLKNESKDPIPLLDVFGTQTGNLHIEISQNGKDYVDFNSPGWNEIDIVAKTLFQPGEYLDASAQVLWMWLKQDVPGFMLTKSGDYYVKSRYAAWIEGEKAPIKIESEPIRITVEEPVGEDLEVWNKIKRNGNFAYFILEGELRIPSYKPEEQARFQQEVEQILIDHPNSFYAVSLRQSLDKFRASEAKRQEYLRKVKKQNQ